jgi:hypothetical protein
MFNDYWRRRKPNENTSRVCRASHEDGTQTGDARLLKEHRTSPIYRRTSSVDYVVFSAWAFAEVQPI